MTMRNKANDTDSRLLSAFRNSKYKYRTAYGIARELNIDVDRASKLLISNPKIRVSFVRASDGNKLYALKEQVSAMGDIWTAFKDVNMAKFG